MPAPQRVTRAALTAEARAIAEREGVDAVTISAVAAAVGVRAPSLYKHVAHRHDLLRLIADDAARELDADVAALAGSAAGPAETLAAIARAFRAFSARSPRATSLLFSGAALGTPPNGALGTPPNAALGTPPNGAVGAPSQDTAVGAPSTGAAPGTRPPSDGVEALTATLLNAVRTATPGDPLPAARTLTAWAYGFCTMEQAGAFQLGGDVDEAFEFGLDAIVTAVIAHGSPRAES